MLNRTYTQKFVLRNLVLKQILKDLINNINDSENMEKEESDCLLIFN